MYMNCICMYFLYIIFFNPAVMKMKMFTEKSDDAHGSVPLQWWCSWLYMSHSSDDSHGYVPLQWWFSWLCPTPVMILMVMSYSSDDSHGYVPLQWWFSWLCPTPVMSYSSDDSYGSVPLHWWCSWLCPTPTERRQQSLGMLQKQRKTKNSKTNQ